MILILATLIAFAFGALGAFFALQTGSGEAVQGLFPLLFVGLFLSSMNLPRKLIETDWFRIVATLNPISYLIEAHPEPDHRGLERGGARPRLRHVRC